VLGLSNSKSHGRFRDLLSMYVDQRLDGAQVATLEEHLVTCGRCHEELQTLRATINLLQALPHAIPGRSFALTERPQIVRSTAPAYLWGMRAATAVASIALVLLVTGDLSGIFSRDIAQTSEVNVGAVERSASEVDARSSEIEGAAESDAFQAEGEALSEPLSSQVQVEAVAGTEEMVPVTALEVALGSLLVLLALVTLLASWRIRRDRSPA